MVLDLLDHLGAEVLLEQLGAGETEESTSSSSGWAPASAAARGSSPESRPVARVWAIASRAAATEAGSAGGLAGAGSASGAGSTAGGSTTTLGSGSGAGETGDWVGAGCAPGSTIVSTFQSEPTTSIADSADDLGAAAAVERLAGAGVVTRYRVILADPPWTFATYSAKGKGRSAEMHYDCMALDNIKALPVDRWAAPDAVDHPPPREESEL